MTPRDHKRPQAYRPDHRRSEGFSPWIPAVVVLLIILAAYLWYNRAWLPDPGALNPLGQPEQVEQAGDDKAPTGADAGRPEADEGPRYKIPELPAADVEDPSPEAPDSEAQETGELSMQQGNLPPLEESDAPIREEVVRSTPSRQQQLQDWFVPESMIRHFVVTIDNLPRAKLPWKYSFVEPAPGKFQVRDAEGQDTYYLDPANFERYERYISFAESLNLDMIVNVYVRYYPLFQQAYEDLGYPNRYFNDRLVEVIDHLLAAPIVEPPIKLLRPKVYYKYADPELENMSAGHKLLIRSGPDNTRQIKAWLQQLRAKITGLAVEAEQ